MVKLAIDNVFRSAFIAQTRAMLSQADALGKQGHAGHRGALREELFANLLRKVLPPGVEIGAGQLVAVDGALSRQIDIILYAPSIVVPALYDEKRGYFAVDSCLYTIEIKSTIDKAGLQQAYESARGIRSMPTLKTEHWSRVADGQLQRIVTLNAMPISALFAFSSDLQGSPNDEIERYRSIDPEAETNPAIAAFIVRGRGYWFHDQNVWKFVRADEDLNEVMMFLAGLVNTLPKLLTFKGRPRAGNFLAQGQIEDA